MTFGLWGCERGSAGAVTDQDAHRCRHSGADDRRRRVVAERTARLIDLPLEASTRRSRRTYRGLTILAAAASVQHSVSVAAMASFLSRSDHGRVHRWRHAVARPLRRGLRNTTMCIVLLIFRLCSTLGAACAPTALALHSPVMRTCFSGVFTFASVAVILRVAWSAWQFGPIGAASAIALVFATANLCPVRVAIRSLGINPTIFGCRG